jgi:phosphoenolpyruvate phosphomutase
VKKATPYSFRSVVSRGDVTRVAGAHDALGAVLAQEAGFDAVWSSSLGVSAARCLPDASLLTMTEQLQAANSMHKVLEIPVVADCDTGYGDIWNVAHMVHEFQSAGITAICIEDKAFPKLNSFADGPQRLLPTTAFAKKITTAKNAQAGDDFFVIARTEALIGGLQVADALERCHAYVDAGADAVLVHSKAPSKDEVLTFLKQWDGSRPVVIIPTSYPDWHADDARRAGVSVIIYANQGLRATISTLRATFRSVLENGSSTAVEETIASMSEVFSLQRLAEWSEIGNSHTSTRSSAAAGDEG